MIPSAGCPSIDTRDLRPRGAMSVAVARAAVAVVAAILAAAVVAALPRISAATVRAARREGLGGAEELAAVDSRGDSRQGRAQNGRHDEKVEASP